MPEHIIETVLVGKTPAEYEEAGMPMMIQKRINLPAGHRFQVLQIQCFDDNMEIIGTDTLNSAVTREIYVTPYPIVPTDEEFGFTQKQRQATLPQMGMGAYAGDKSVLYKRLDWTYGDFNAATLNPQVNQFNQKTYEYPSPQIAAASTHTWHTPHLYLSCKYNQAQAYSETPVALSFYIKLKITKCSSLESSIGIYKEMCEAFARSRTDTGVTILPLFGAAGRSIPTWKFGGIRPEIMINSNNLLRYYGKLASQAYQGMEAADAFRVRFKQARTMDAYDQGFGDSATNIPDWITLMDVSGITSGKIRPYPPPTKYSGNGNTVMYDANGIPASVVT